jgi:hypothetical protein
VITNAREILHPAAANKHNRVLLQVVADAWNVSRNLNPIGEANTRDLAKGGVRLLGGLGVNAGADATANPAVRGWRSYNGWACGPA